MWGVNKAEHIFRLKQDNTWKRISGSLKHVTVGDAGVWGVNKRDLIFYYLGGSSWRRIPGRLKQIDSGPGRIVYGVNRNDGIFCRTGKI